MNDNKKRFNEYTKNIPSNMEDNKEFMDFLSDEKKDETYDFYVKLHNATINMCDGIVKHYLRLYKTDVYKYINEYNFFSPKMFYKSLKTNNINISRAYYLYYTMKLKDIETSNFLKKCKTIVKPSEIHGNGLFSDEFIKKYTFIGFYPCDGTFTYNEGNDEVIKNKMYYDFMIFGVDDPKYEELSKYSIGDKVKFFKYTVEIFGDKNNHTTSNVHLINESINEPNCMYKKINGLHCVFSIKNISKGKELFVDYGDQYVHSET